MAQPPTILAFLSATGTLPILTYCAASILMTVTNKYVLSGYDFNMNFLLLGIQSIVCVVLLRAFKMLNLVSFREFDLALSRKWFPIAMLLVAMIYTGSKSLQYLSIPVYTIFKNLTIILIAYGEVIWFDCSISRLTMTSFLLMVFSSIIAALSDSSSAVVKSSSITFDIGYLWMAFNCISSAAFVLTMRRRIRSTNFKDFDTVYYNNLLSIPLLMTMSLMVEDWSEKNFEKNLPEDIRTTLITAILFSGISAFGISYTSAWCVRVTSSTTYSMVGALNKLPVAASGMIFFGDPITTGNVSAIFVGFVAGILYSIAKTEQQKPIKPSVYIPISNKELPQTTTNDNNTTEIQSNLLNNDDDHRVIKIEDNNLSEKM
ncbi:GDP-mannose transporter [Rhizophagus irregularis]|uniref:GDP-mannose transporter n=3 Tax=Rhizophagus irregularis TaxID=588596 RepID=A0A015I5G9_RHIIW|nr:GDP-mannose transporter into the lumen of the Golgi [Rhizophagus irregularis DAOM 181602=DAOM 197198]EXX52297.1 Vrg4p [Rhizophagus irregularis DAOM 197198w]POG78420.1 GDP-mannose transporter into the lumen of the Golgi [Rhizophagus irregularis DAOM 181602=DAOM 197198]UZO14276.1 GDP-mannose transporter [Rhizophagus irregularis]GBC50096.1 GDP-mannose transporter [Rhizophagus irregularis DAOM 181602=DAOM 197198]|eukprot:XP_025185286.1 GDP-mannose transporter into the lumen of the Golgi [Rhizophagus irregularis DAOM 181602=DAOM 197198]